MDNKFLLFGGIGLVIIAVLVFVNSPANSSANPTPTVTPQPIVPTVTSPSFVDTTSVDALQHEIVSVEQELAMLSAAQNHTITTA